MKKEYKSIAEGAKDFYEEIGYNFTDIDYSCATDGRIKQGTNYGSLLLFRLDGIKSDKDYEQMLANLCSLNSKAKSLPKYGVCISLNTREYQVFSMETTEFFEVKNWDNPTELKEWIEKTDIRNGWIDSSSIVAYNDLFYDKTKSKSKDDFISELGMPTVLPITPYQWNEQGEMERRMLDCIGPKSLKKRLGAFFTPQKYAIRSAKMVRQIIENTSENDEILIVDRCAGTGNLEEALLSELRVFSDDKYNLLLNTITYSERMTLNGLFGKRCKILPDDLTVNDDGLLIHGDALSKEFNDKLLNEINLYREQAKSRNHNLVVIMYENPPYSAPGGDLTGNKQSKEGNRDNYVVSKMREKHRGIVLQELVNQFIYSAFDLIKVDYYVVYAPIKYWKRQSLIDKEFLGGFVADRADFHATSSAGIPVIAWKNIDCENEELRLENAVIKKVHKKITELVDNPDRKEGNVYFYQKQGFPDFKQALLTNVPTPNTHAKPNIFNGDEEELELFIPLFAANCYVPSDYTEREIIMKSGDGGKRYQSDKSFLDDCFIWSGLSKQNKGSSNDELRNEYCFCQNTKADERLKKITVTDKQMILFEEWKALLDKASRYDEFNKNYTYGLNQLSQDIGSKHKELAEEIKKFDELLKVYFKMEILPKLFEYELLK